MSLNFVFKAIDFLLFLISFSISNLSKFQETTSPYMYMDLLIMKTFCIAYRRPKFRRNDHPPFATWAHSFDTFFKTCIHPSCYHNPGSLALASLSLFIRMYERTNWCLGSRSLLEDRQLNWKFNKRNVPGIIPLTPSRVRAGCPCW